MAGTGELYGTYEKKARKGKAKEGPVKTLKIRIFPGEKTSWLEELHTQSRWFYNAAVNICYRHFGDLQELKIVPSEQELRELVQGNKYVVETTYQQDPELIIQWKSFQYDEEHKDWPTFPGKPLLHNRLPRGAVTMFARNLKSALTNLQEGYNKGFRMKYKSKKHSQTYSTFFEDSSFPRDLLKLSSTYCYTTRKQGRNKRTSISFKEIFLRDPHKSGFTLEHDRLTDKHYILYTVPAHWYPPTDRRNDSQVLTVDEEAPKVLSCDPGVRTFITGYDPAGSIVSVAAGANQELYNMLSAGDEFWAQHALSSDPQKQASLKHQALLLNRKIQNRVRELHWKTARFMVLNYDLIVLPHFETSQMLRGRKLHKATKRQLQVLSFFQFKEKLKYLCKKYHKRLVLVQEDYTSKTCGACGKLNQELGASKSFDCPHCGLSIDRDENGARNILLKNLQGISSW